MTRKKRTDPQRLFRVLVRMACIDGALDPNEALRIQALMQRLVDTSVSPHNVTTCAAEVANTTLEQMLEGVTLTDIEKGMYVQAAYAVISADGRVDAREDKRLIALARLLNLPTERFAQLVSPLAMARWLTD